GKPSPGSDHPSIAAQDRCRAMQHLGDGARAAPAVASPAARFRAASPARRGAEAPMSKILVLVTLLVAIIAAAASGRAEEGVGNTAPGDTHLLPEGDAFALYDRGFFHLRR